MVTLISKGMKLMGTNLSPEILQRLYLSNSKNLRFENVYGVPKRNYNFQIIQTSISQFLSLRQIGCEIIIKQIALLNTNVCLMVHRKQIYEK